MGQETETSHPIWLIGELLRSQGGDVMKPRIPTPAGRVSLVTLAIVGAAQAVVWLVRSQKARSRDPSAMELSEIDPIWLYRCCC